MSFDVSLATADLTVHGNDGVFRFARVGRNPVHHHCEDDFYQVEYLVAVDVFFGVDENYARPLATAVRSAIDNCSDPSRLRIHVVESGVSAASRRRLRSSWPGDVDINFIQFPPALFAKLPTGRTFETQHTSAAGWLRAFAPDLLPPDTQRAIYLDTDVLVTGDLVELYETDLGGAPVGAVLDIQPTFAGAKLTVTDNGVTYGGSLPYFNSGVLLCDIAAWRERDTPRLVLGLIERHIGRLPHRDQDALNIVFANNWKDIGLRWNNIVFGRADHRGDHKRAAESLAWGPGVLHFFGPRKPWTTACNGERSKELWRQFEASTAWAGEPLIPTIGRTAIGAEASATGLAPGA